MVQGQLYRHYDEAGRLEISRYDFKGNVKEKKREVISDTNLLSVFNGPPTNWQVNAYRVDWTPGIGQTIEQRAAALLDTKVYLTSISYDALNRISIITLPEKTAGGRNVLVPKYSKAGALKQVLLAGSIAILKDVAYNARGQRLLVARGNDVMTRCV